MITVQNRSLTVATIIFLYVIFAPPLAEGQDWPSWRGHGQNGVSEQKDLISSWSVDGENLIWSDSWIGRSTPAVFDGRVCAPGYSLGG